jgi:hypothetical protein
MLAVARLPKALKSVACLGKTHGQDECWRHCRVMPRLTIKHALWNYLRLLVVSIVLAPLLPSDGASWESVAISGLAVWLFLATALNAVLYIVSCPEDKLPVAPRWMMRAMGVKSEDKMPACQASNDSNSVASS